MAVVNIDYEVTGRKDILKTEKSLENLNKTTTQAQKQTESYNKNLVGLGDRLKGLANNFNVAGQGAGDLASGMFKSAKATNTMSKSLRVLKIALAATGIGAVVVLLGSLTAFFTKSATGSRLLSKAMAALNGVTDLLTQKLASLGEEMFNTAQESEGVSLVFEKILDFVLNLPNAIGKVIGSFKIFGEAASFLMDGEFAKAAETAGKGVGQLVDGVTDLNIITASFKDLSGETDELVQEFIDAAEASAKLKEAQDDLLITQRNLRIQVATLSAEEERLNQIADDSTISLDAQNRAGLQASLVAEQRAQKEIAASNEILRVLQQEFNTRKALSFEEQQDLLDRVAEARIAVTESESRLTQIRESNAIRLRQIDQDTFEQRLDFLFDVTDNQKAVNERILKDERLTLEERRKILDETVKFNEESFQKIADEFQKQAGERIAIEELLAETDAEKVFRQLELAELSEIENTRFLEFIRERKLAEQDLAEAKKDLDDEELKRTEEIEEKKKTLATETAKAEVEAKKEGTDAIAGLISQGFQGTKEGAIFNILLSTKEAAVAAFKAVVGIPIVGPALAPIAAGAATAFGLSSLQDVKAQGVPQFGDGGEVMGPSHINGGVLAELEGGEFVFKKKAVDNIGLSNLKAMNEGSAPTVVDATKVIEVPRDSLYVDGNGFTMYQYRKNSSIKKKQSRYSWR